MHGQMAKLMRFRLAKIKIIFVDLVNGNIVSSYNAKFLSMAHLAGFDEVVVAA